MVTVKELRKKMGLTQEAFARRFDISVSSVRNWEQGVTQPPSYFISLVEENLRLKGEFDDDEEKGTKKS